MKTAVYGPRQIALCGRPCKAKDIPILFPSAMSEIHVTENVGLRARYFAAECVILRGA
jgi:hypothetical protein